jgi:Spy/CpxP family protein refolding chaperone
MKSIRLRFLAATAAALLAAAMGQAQTADTAAPPPPHGHEFGMGGPMFGFYAKELDLTDAQRAQAKSVMQKEHATMHPLMEQMHQLDTQLKQYEEGTYDATKVQALVAQQSQTLVQLKVEESRIHNELYQLLTSDQQAKLKELEADHEARMQQHMQAPPASDSQE